MYHTVPVLGSIWCSTTLYNTVRTNNKTVYANSTEYDKLYKLDLQVTTYRLPKLPDFTLCPTAYL